MTGILCEYPDPDVIETKYLYFTVYEMCIAGSRMHFECKEQVQSGAYVHMYNVRILPDQICYVC